VKEAAKGRRERLRVAAEQAGQRLDRFLVGALDGVSRRTVKAALDAGRVHLDGRPTTRAGMILRGGEEICLTIAEATMPAARFSAVPSLREIYRDAWLLAVDKPPGLLCHDDGCGGPHALAQAAAFSGPSATDEGPYLLHRLDAGTSGLLLFARQRQAAVDLGYQFARHEVRKIYLALVAGQPPDGFEVDLALQPGRGGRMKIAAGEGGQSASTSFRVLQRGPDMALVEASPHTGRTHQIRVHLAASGFPLLGDTLYGGPSVVTRGHAGIAIARPLLHSRQLTFRHPASREIMTLEAGAPDDFRRLLELFQSAYKGYNPRK
jgi:RluA family pseudouridine synthase